MLQNYAPFADRMISRYEGGYGWDRADPGGPTKYGITCYDYAEFRGRKMNSMAAWAPLVKAMTLQEAEAIYAKKYALAIRFDDLPSGVDACMMDYSVNSGVARAIRVARALLGVPGPDKMDLQLFDAIRKTNPERFINLMCDERLAFMKRIRKGTAWAKFGKGWSARVADLRAYCERLARGYSAATAPKAVDLSQVWTAKTTNVAPSATKASTFGGIAVGAGAHLTGFSIWYALVAVAVVVVVGAAYTLWRQHKTDAENAVILEPAHVG